MNQYGEWTDEREAAFRELWSSYATNDAVLAALNAMPGRPLSIWGLRVKASKLGIARPPKLRWPAERVAALAELFPHAADIAPVTTRLNELPGQRLTETAVFMQARRMRLHMTAQTKAIRRAMRIQRRPCPAPKAVAAAPPAPVVETPPAPKPTPVVVLAPSPVAPPPKPAPFAGVKAPRGGYSMLGGRL